MPAPNVYVSGRLFEPAKVTVLPPEPTLALIMPSVSAVKMNVEALVEAKASVVFDLPAATNTLTDVRH